MRQATRVGTLLRLAFVLSLLGARGLSAQEASRKSLPLEGGRTLRYEATGAGEAVVFLHAGWVDSRMWAAQLEEFGRDHRAIAYDLCGFGESKAGEQPCNDLADLRALLDHLNIQKATLVGTSLGGMVALDFAIRYPDRVAALVLANPALSGHAFSSASLTAWGRVERLLQEGRREEALSLRMEDPWLAPTLSNPRAAAVLGPLLRDNAKASPKRFVLTPPAASRLREVAAPVLLLIGDHDHADMQELAQVLSRGLPSLSRTSLPGGHFTNLESPVEFNSAIRGFLEARSGVTGAFFALSVADVQTLSRWYQEKLDFKVLSQGEAPSGIAKFAILLRGGAVLELIQHRDARPLGTAAPDVKSASQIHGIFKAGLVVKDIDGLYRDLRQKAVPIAYDLMPAKDVPMRSFSIRDAEGNMLQFFGR